jgi:hypothetical protein
MSEDNAFQSDPRVGMVLTGLLGVGTAALIVWAQQGPGFEWDPQAARWITNTIPGLGKLAYAVSWPVVREWPFAVGVLITVLGLCASRHPRAAVETLGAVAGGMLLSAVFTGLPMGLAPNIETLYYGSFFGGVSLALYREVDTQTRTVLMVVSAILSVLPGLALVATGQLPSAWVISMLLVLSWLTGLHQIAK